jgi:hypothetical protein
VTTTDKALKVRRKLRRMFKQAVPESDEFRRVASVPRRTWSEEQLAEAVDALTWGFKMPHGTQTLRPIQASALAELHDFGGLFGPIQVGWGKTLISYLAPVLVGAQRPLLVIPAKLRQKTEYEFAELSKHWVKHPDYAVESYERISRATGAEILAERKPDLFVFDEVHRIKNRGAAVTRKITQYMEDNPDTKVVAMSGTIIKRSLLDFSHILRWCLPTELYPLPLSELELEAWAAAVDEIKQHEKRMRGGIGALALLHPEVGSRFEITRKDAREAVRMRLHQTPGVIASQGSDVDASLNIELVKVGGYNSRTERLVADLKAGVKPNGEPVTDNDLASRWRITRTLTSGFWYKWDPEPPAEWMEARSAWKKFARSVLLSHQPGLESEALVARAASLGKLGDRGQRIYLAWREIKDTYKVNTVPVWEDMALVNAIEKWVNQNTGIVWVNDVPLGQKLQERGLRYYHRMGLDSKGNFIDHARGTKKGDCIVASIDSNCEGRNLQHWNNNLITSPMPTGSTWNQLLGRTHRPGQEEDEVWATVMVCSAVERECWEQALRDNAAQTSLDGDKKLTVATIDQGAIRFGAVSNSALWN